jgi:CubicO group peptidase (beta-lactamase class C family)
MSLSRLSLLAAWLLASLSARGQEGQAPDLAATLARLEKAIEAKRAELRVPGVSVAVVAGDRAVLLKGFGLRDVGRNLPATPDTLYAIGSCSKAFTGMAAVMSADDGKLSLDDPPRKHLPYFRLKDPDADAKITVRDLLTHTSGLDRTDISWYTGVLSREEAIRVAGLAAPKARFRARYQYQNNMYSAAGEVVARAQGASWEEFIARRFFEPLGMKSSTVSVREMEKAADYATGYSLEDGQARKAMLRDLTNIAPAGAINSNVRDMSCWVRFLLGGGTFEGRRLVSEEGFREAVKSHVSMGGSAGYGLGWILSAWNGHRVVSHGGGIDGFNALVEFLPDRKVGLVVLTNVSGSGLPGAIREAAWSALVGRPDAPAAAPVPAPAASDVPPRGEAGTYAAGAVRVEVLFQDGKLWAEVAGQPRYELIPAGGRRYRLGAPAPEGYFATFRPVQGKESETELFLEQPQGNVALRRAAGRAPEPKGETPNVGLSADEVHAKAVAAAGGEANLRKVQSLAITSTLELEHQGLTGESVFRAQAPNRAATETTLFGLEKKIGTMRSYFDGAHGGAEASFSLPQAFGGAALENARLAADFHELLNWKTLYASVAVREKTKLDGEEAYVVVKTPAKGDPVTEFFSARTFLPLRRDRTAWTGPGQGGRVVRETFGDYREVQGVLLPHRTVTEHPALGRIAATVKEVRCNVPLDADAFRASAK